jgi:uncharacterized delta-60 repeat protein
MRKIALGVFGVYLLFGFTPIARAWESNLVGSGKFSFGYGLAVKVDSGGSVVAAGALSNSGGDLDFIVLKFSANGNELWRKTIRGTASGSGLATTNEAKALEVAGDGSIAAAGFTGNTGTGADFTVVKLDTNGNELWRRVINGSVNADDEARAVSVDGSGNIIAAGLLANSATGKDFFVVKFDASGNELWRYTLNGTANVDDQANGLAVDGSGNVFAAGTLTNTGTSTDFAVVKIAGATGAEMWRRVIDGKANLTDFANGLALDAAGNLFTVGQILDGTDPNNNQNHITALIVKIDGSNGNELWRDTNSLLFNPIGTAVHANAVAVDASGNPTIAGQLHFIDSGEAFQQWYIKKYDGTSGAALTSGGGPGGSQVTAEALSVAVDATGNIYAAGYLDFSPCSCSSRDFTVLKLAAADLRELWRRSITAGGNADAAFGVAVDGAGNAVAVGTVESRIDAADENFFTAAKLDAASGGDVWVQFVGGSSGNGVNAGLAIALDSAGDVLATGYLQNSGGRLDFSVAKLEHDTGNELWRNSIKGDADDDDKAVAIAVDGGGNAIAAGYIVNRSTGADFAVVKFDGASGAEIWRKIIDGGAEPDVPDQATAVAVDGHGNVFAVGFLSFPSRPGSFLVLKLDGASGAELWRATGLAGQALSLAIDGAGDAVVAGRVLNSNFDTAVIKFSGANGSVLWHQTVGTANFSTNEAQAVAVDSVGNVVAGGFLASSTTLIKYNGATGAEIWRNFGIAATHIAADGAGNIAVGGATAGDFAVSKLDGSTGNELWRRLINGTANGSGDFARRVAVDAQAEVFAVGNISNQNSGSDILIVKLDRSSGAEIWRKEIDGSLANSFDQGWGLALDAAGNVAAVGSTQEPGASGAFAVVMLNGADGNDFTGGTPSNVAQPVVWTHVVNATANGNSLTKTGGCAWCDDAGAVSVQQIASGDGYMEFTASELTTNRAVGLSNGDTDNTRTDIDFAVMMWKTMSGVNYVEVYENSVWKAGQFYQTGDIFRVAVQGGVVKYSKNGALWYTSAKAPVYPLLVDTSLWNAGATINNVMIAGGGGSPPPPPPPPPVGTGQDIGAVALAGSDSSSNGTVTIRASGNDIWNTADAFRFVFQSLSGDGQITARVASLQNTDAWAKAGVMIRESTAANSTHAFMALTPGNGAAFQRRQTTGAFSLHTAGPFVAAPYWVKLVRSGNTFTGSVSTDGVTWTMVGSDTVTMGTNALIGLAVTSHNNAVLTTAVIDSVTIQAGGNPPPPPPPPPPPSPSVQNVSWTSLANVTASGNSLQKTGGCAWCDDAGAISTQHIASGDGYMEFTASEMTTNRAVGLSQGNTDNTRTDIDFTMMMWKTISGVNYVEVYENSVWKAGQTYQTGDVLRIAVVSGVVQYFKNGTLWYTSAKAPAYPLLVDTSLWDAGSTITNVVISSPQLVN